MKKIIILNLCLFIGISSLFAGATVKEFFGKVKVKYNGDTKWSRIDVGMELPANAVVSTGFNSQIVLDLGNATIDVLPLTRMTINEITESQDTMKTSLFLQGGKIKADVGKIEGKINDFVIKSPVATASVRGTAFSFTGNSLMVDRGEVAFSPTKQDNKKSTGTPTGVGDTGTSKEVLENAVFVKAGGGTQMSSIGSKPLSPSAMAKKKLNVSSSTKPAVVKIPVRENMAGLTVESVAPIISDVISKAKTTTRVKIEIIPVED